MSYPLWESPYNFLLKETVVCVWIYPLINAAALMMDKVFWYARVTLSCGPFPKEMSYSALRGVTRTFFAAVSQMASLAEGSRIYVMMLIIFLL